MQPKIDSNETNQESFSNQGPSLIRTPKHIGLNKGTARLLKEGSLSKEELAKAGKIAVERAKS